MHIRQTLSETNRAYNIHSPSIANAHFRLMYHDDETKTTEKNVYTYRYIYIKITAQQ